MGRNHTRLGKLAVATTLQRVKQNRRMVIDNLEQAVQQLQAHTHRRKWYRRWLSHSAVAMILRQCEGGLEILMIERAHREGDPWSGQMAFPGGRAEPADASSLHTARRETWEEIGLDTHEHTQHIGRLSDLRSHMRLGRKPIMISPHLFTTSALPPLTPNYEVADTVWVPLNFLAAEANRDQFVWKQGGINYRLPCYRFGDRLIWGLSLRMLDELIDVLRID